MGKGRSWWLVMAVWVVFAASLPGCATNPVSGHSEFVLMSEDQEIKLGREAYPKILKQYGGAYDDATLQAYVQRVGEAVAAHSHRPGLIYRFTVVDSDQVNAFALPGGYIFITRGLLAYLNSEAELAAVLGHEIGHVTARHAVRQITAAQTARLGYALGSIFVPELRSQSAQDLFNVLGGAFLSGYGRDHELEADRLGAEYLARSGYDPQAMIKVIGVLKEQEEFDKRLAEEEGRKPRAYHGVFASHPDNDTRLQAVVGAAAQLKEGTAVPAKRDSFLEQLEGLTIGDSEREGIRRNSHFYHKGLGIAVAFPQGWRVENLPNSVLAHPRAQDGILEMSTEDLNRRITPREFMVRRLKRGDLKEGEALAVNGLEAYTAISWLRTPFGNRPVRLAVVYFNNRAFVFAGAAKDEIDPRKYDPLFLAAIKSFHPLLPEERPFAEALKLHIIRADKNTRFAALAKDSPLAHHPEEQLRLLNQRYPAGEPVAGEWIKVVQ